MNSIFFTIFFVLGLLLGSFLNVVILRTRQGVSAMKGRSRCPSCQHQLSWYENLPLASFMMQKGICRHCQATISWQYPLVELSTALLFGFLAIQSMGDYLLLIRNLLLVSCLIVVFVYDLRWQEIWDRFTTLPAVALFIYQWWFGLLTPVSMLLGVLCVAGFFLLQFVLSKGQWIGGGDVRLGVLMGVVLGPVLGGVALLVSYVAGASIGVILLSLGRKNRSDVIPFGTFLSCGTMIALLFGNQIIDWYISFL